MFSTVVCALSRAYLESIAKKYIDEALVHEKAGNLVEAAKTYRRAAQVLMTIVSNYPHDPLASVYREIAESLRKKADALEGKIERETKIAVSGGEEEDYHRIAKEFVLEDKPPVTFDEIVGLEEAKQALLDCIVYPSKRPDLFPLGWPRGILLYGPPGCGKTMLAAAVANEIDCVFMQVDAANIMSKWLGDAEKRVAAIFKYAREKYSKERKPVVIFIDEADALLGIYEHELGGEARVRNQFLKEMDGLNTKGRNLMIYVIAATNKPWKLDMGFIRRFQRRIYVPPPDLEMRKQLFQHYTKYIKFSDDVDFDELARATEGYSACDIRDVVMEAYLITVRELFRRGNLDSDPRPVTMEDFRIVLRRKKPSITPEIIRLYEEWSKRFGST